MGDHPFGILISTLWKFSIAFLIIEITNGLDETYCERTSMCSLLVADLQMEYTNNTTDEIYVSYTAAALKQMKSQRRYDRSKLTAIQNRCKDLFHECRFDLQILASRNSYPVKLVNHCSVESLPYTMFLCKYIKNWAKSITNLASEWFTSCNKPCITLFPEWDAFHRPKHDKPNRWSKNLEKAVRLRRLMEAKKPKLNELRSSQLILWSPEEYTVIYTGPSSGAEYSINQSVCPEKSYIASLNTFDLPKGISADCFSNGNPGEKLASIQTQFATPNHLKTVPCLSNSTIPLEQGSFVIGIIVYTSIVGSGHVISAVEFVCSGQWDYHGNEKKEGTLNDPRLICPTLSAICMIHGAHREEKEEMYLINIAVGCCAMPESYYYSSVRHQTSLKYMDAHMDGQKQVLVDTDTDFGDGKSSVYCKPGKFINHFKWDIFFPKQVERPDNEKDIMVMRMRYYCNGYDTINSDGDWISEELYTHVTSKGEERGTRSVISKPFPDGYKCNGFYVGGKFEVSDVPRDGYHTYYDYYMLCSDGKWIGHKFDTNDMDFVADEVDDLRIYFPDSEYGKGQFLCENNHAICGVTGTRTGKKMVPHGSIFEFTCCPIPKLWPSHHCRPNGITVELEEMYPSCNLKYGRERDCEVNTEDTIESSQKENRTQRKKRHTASPENYVYTNEEFINSIIRHPQKTIGEEMRKLFTTIPENRITTTSHTIKKRQSGIEVATLVFTIIGAIATVIGTGGTIYQAAVPNKSPDVTIEDVQRHILIENTITTTRKLGTKSRISADSTQQTLYYNVKLSCGKHAFYSDKILQLETPSYKNCTLKHHLEFLWRHNDQTGSPSLQTKYASVVKKNFGFGLHFHGYDRRLQGLGKHVKWEYITMGASSVFDDILQMEGVSSVADSFQPGVWEEYKPDGQVHVNLTFNRGEKACIYRVVAQVCHFELYTNFIVVNKTTGNLILCDGETRALWTKDNITYHAAKLTS